MDWPPIREGIKLAKSDKPLNEICSEYAGKDVVVLLNDPNELVQYSELHSDCVILINAFSERGKVPVNG